MSQNLKTRSFEHDTVNIKAMSTSIWESLTNPIARRQVDLSKHSTSVDKQLVADAPVSRFRENVRRILAGSIVQQSDSEDAGRPRVHSCTTRPKTRLDLEDVLAGLVAEYQRLESRLYAIGAGGSAVDADARKLIANSSAHLPVADESELIEARLARIRRELPVVRRAIELLKSELGG